MSSNQKKYLRLAIVLLPALIFIISLTQNGFSYQYIDVETPKSYSLLLMGGMAFIGGGLFETLIWIANPIALIAIFRFLIESNASVKIEPFLKKTIPKPNSYWLSALAALIAWSFSLWNEVLAAESGSMGKILSLELGYWLWVSSFTILAIGINYFHFKISNR